MKKKTETETNMIRKAIPVAKVRLEDGRYLTIWLTAGLRAVAKKMAVTIRINKGVRIVINLKPT